MDDIGLVVREDSAESSHRLRSRFNGGCCEYREGACGTPRQDSVEIRDRRGPLFFRKGSFDPVPDSRHVKGKSLPVGGTVEGLLSKSTLQCIVTGATGHYFFYDTYDNTHADKGAWNAEVLLGPDPPKITLPKNFTLILVAAPQSAMDEIGRGEADTGAYNVDGLSRIPPDAETLAEIAITRDS